MFKKFFTKAAMFAALGAAFAMGCGAPDADAENQEIIQNLVKAGYPAQDIMVADGLVYVARDAHVTLEASREMITLQSGTTKEQYRTTNLVSGPMTICVNPTSQFNSYSRLSQGLDGAIAAYNALNLSLRFQRGGTGCAASISARTTSGVGGSSGFPSGGKPYGTINIGTGLQSYSVGVNQHVIMHEIGHTIGFRHTDYYNRAISCGSGGNEGASNVGAIHIPGTPTDARVGGSVMNSCFRSSESGNWSSSDKVALDYLY